MNIAVIILAASTDQDKIEMTQAAVDSVKSKQHRVNVLVVDSHVLHPYRNSRTILQHEPFNYNRNLKEGIRYIVADQFKYDYFLVLNNDVLLGESCIDNLINTGLDSCSPKDPTLAIHEAYKGITFGYRTSYQLCGWALMFSRYLLYECGIDTLFPNELPFWFQDNFYGHVIKANKFQHALIADAHCIHLESKTHELLTNRHDLTEGLRPKYDELIRQFDLQFSTR
jgi:GT2 family glycosyltransferase